MIRNKVFKKIFKSKFLAFYLIFSFLFLITTEVNPNKVDLDSNKEFKPVVRVKEAGEEIPAGQKNRFERLIEEGKKLFQEEMDHEGAKGKFKEAQALAITRTQKADVYFYLSLVYYATLEEKGPEEFDEAIRKLIEIDYYREPDLLLCPPRYMVLFQGIKKEYGALKIQSKPAGADVYLNYSNVPVGKTPLTIGSKAGSVKIRVKRGRKEKKETLRVIAGKETASSILVLKGGSSLLLIIGGIVLAGAAGAAFIKSKPGEESGVTPGSTTGSIQVTSNPTGAQVFLDGSNTGETTDCTLTDVSPGSHTVKLVMEGYEDEQMSVSVTAGQTATVSTTLTKPTITVIEIPPDTVWTTGKEVEIKWDTSGSGSSQGVASTGAGLNPLINQGRRALSRFQRRAFQERRFLRSAIKERRSLEDVDSSGNRGILSGSTSKPQGVSGEFSSSAKEGDIVHKRAKNTGNIKRKGIVGRVNMPVSPQISNDKFTPSGNIRALDLSNVKIELYKGATFNQNIAESTENDGSYLWTVDPSLEGGTDYKVRISSPDDSTVYGESPNFEIQDPNPNAPSDLEATAVSSSQVDLSWDDNSSDEDGFKVERKKGTSGIWNEIDTVSSNITAYQDKKLDPNIIYCYRIKAFKGQQYSDYSNEGCATLLAAPTNMQATKVSSSQINLSWTDNSSDETGFKIERKEGASGTWTQIIIVGLDSTTYQDTELDEYTTYYYRVRAYNEVGNSGYSNEPSATTDLAAPTNLQATAISSSQVDLSWEDNLSSEDGFKIERKKGTSVTWTEINTVGANAESYQDTGLEAETTYYYKVRAYKGSQYSDYSEEGSANTSEVVPAAPSNLEATAVSSSQIDLSWADNSNNESGFKIESKEGASGTWFQIAAVNADVTTYEDTGIEAETSYYYQIRAYNAAGNSDYSNEASATIELAAPTNLQATAVSSSQVDLSWEDNSSNEDGFKIERKKGTSVTWTEINTVGANAESYQDTGLEAETTYYYKVRAYKGSQYSDYSEEDSASTSEVVPAAPTNLQATAVSSSQIDLSWTDNSNNESGFKIERKEGASGTWFQINTVNADVTTYEDTGLEAETTYYYQVRAYNEVGNSDYSNEPSATTELAAPTNLQATAVSSSQIDLSWTDNSNNESGFKIEWKKGTSVTWTEINVGANTESYQDTGLEAEATYYYKVRAYKGSQYSDYSEEDSASTSEVVPAAPSNLEATAVSSSQIDLSWTDNSNNESGFKIEWKERASGEWFQINTVNADVTTYEDTGLEAETTYYYQVRAYNEVGNSDYSNEPSATTELAAPTNLQATAVSSSQIDLSWTDNSNNESGFKIEWKKEGEVTWTQIIVGPNSTTYQDTGLEAETMYYYRVWAYNATGDSDHSNETSAICLSGPTDLEATTASSSQINLSWTDNSNNESGFEIEWKKEGEVTWTQIIVGPNSTTYQDTGLEAETMYYYIVWAYNATGDSDHSNEASAITDPAPSITVTEPTTSTIWIKDISANITWTSTGVINNVKIDLYKGNTLIEPPIVSSTTNNGSYPWTAVTTSLEDGSDYKVKVSDASDSAIYGESEEFTIEEPPSITVTQPTKDTKWHKGDSADITWESTGVINNVKIELYKCKKNDELEATIADSTTNNGSYTWPKVDTKKGKYKVKISWVTDSTVYGESEEFKIEDK